MQKQIFKIFFILAMFFAAPNFASAGITNITSCGNLNVVNETYVLQNDVTSDGTCFTFDQSGITLDLNGHSVTYANLDFTGVANTGFEDGDVGDESIPTGWDLSGAHGHAYRQSNTQQLFFDNYSLHIDNIAGDANTEEFVETSPVYLPSPGRYAITAEVRGGPYNVLNARLKVEGIDTACNNTTSNMHLSYVGDMSWDLVCEFDIVSAVTIKGRIIVGTKDESKNSGINVDEMDIRPIGLYGIVPSAWNKTMTEIKNGSFIEGRSKASYADGIRGTAAKKIHDLTIITNGINSENINETWSGDLEIYNNYLEANGKLPLNRQYFFSMIDLGRTPGGNKIYNNTLMNGPHVGIFHGDVGSGLNPVKSEIYGNTIKTRITATNGFALMIGGNVDVHNNIVQPFQGHGIGLGSTSDYVKIYDNIIEPRTWPCSEYSSYTYPNSAHGIRIKNYAAGSIDNLEIYGNTIIGKTNPQVSNCYTEVSGITNYLEDDNWGGPVSTNVKIHDNNISVETDNYLQQHAMAYKGMGQGEFYNNTLTSNHIIVDLSDNDVGGADNYKIFDSNTLIKGINPQGFYTLRYGYRSAGNNTFLNTILQNGTDLKNISFGINNGDRSVASYATSTDFAVAWYLGINVKNDSNTSLIGVAAEIRDKDDNLLRELVTDGVGNIIEKLNEYVFSYTSTATKNYTYVSPYTVTLKKIGYKDLTVPLTLDSSKYLQAILENDSSADASSFTLQTITANPAYLMDVDIIAPGAPQGLSVL